MKEKEIPTLEEIIDAVVAQYGKHEMTTKEFNIYLNYTIKPMMECGQHDWKSWVKQTIKEQE